MGRQTGADRQSVTVGPGDVSVTAKYGLLNNRTALASLGSGAWGLFQALSVLFTPAYQSDGWAMPFLRDRVVAPFIHRWPATKIQAAMVTGLMGNPLAALGLDS